MSDLILHLLVGIGQEIEQSVIDEILVSLDLDATQYSKLL